MCIWAFLALILLSCSSKAEEFFETSITLYFNKTWNSYGLAWTWHGSFASVSRCWIYRHVAVPSLKMNFWISHSAIKLIIEVFIFSILFLWIRMGVVSAWIASMSHHTSKPQCVLFCLLPHFHVCLIAGIKPRALVMVGKRFNPPAS